MHKTDGKLFCVAAPIPGAGAGEGECEGAEVHEMGGTTGGIAPHKQWRGREGEIKRKKVKMFSQTQRTRGQQ